MITVVSFIELMGIPEKLGAGERRASATPDYFCSFRCWEKGDTANSSRARLSGPWKAVY